MKVDRKIEITTGNILILLGLNFARLTKNLAKTFLLGLKILIGLAKKIKSSKNNLAKCLYLASTLLGLYLLSISIYYIYLLSSKINPSNNLLVIGFPFYIFLLGLANKIYFKVSKFLLAKKINKINYPIEQKFKAANFKDGLGNYPLLVSKLPQGKYFEELVFYSDINLATWKKI